MATTQGVATAKATSLLADDDNDGLGGEFDADDMAYDAEHVAATSKRSQRKGAGDGDQHRTRVERRGCRPDVLYMLVLAVICLAVVIGIGVYIAVRISGCWPCTCLLYTSPSPRDRG